MIHSKFWWSFVQIRRNNAFRRNLVAQIWHRWVSRSRASWWRRGKIFWWDRRCCMSWNFRRSKWLWAWFRPQFDLLWLFLIGLSSTAIFLAGLSWRIVNLSSHVLLEPPKIFSSRVSPGYPDHKSSQKMILEPGIPRIPVSQVPTNNNSAWGLEWWL